MASARAAHRFTTYASGPGADLELATLVGVADAFLSAQAIDEAMEIFKLADRFHPGTAGLATLAKRIEKAAADDGSGDLSDDLKSLGYLGEG